MSFSQSLASKIPGIKEPGGYCLRLLVGVALSATVWAQAIPSSGTTPPGLESFDTVMNAVMSKHSVPGASLAVFHGGKLVFAKGYGFANKEAGTLVQPDSLFRLASNTKPVVAAAILKLIERGQLTLDAHAFELMPDLTPLPGALEDTRIKSITVAQLLEHTSGWFGESDGTGYDPMFDVVNIAAKAGTASPADRRTIVRYMLGRRLDNDPGKYNSYLNFGYCALSVLIEEISGEPFESFVHGNVFGPLGNDRSQFGSTLTALPGEVTYYDPGPEVASIFPFGPTMVPSPYGGFSVEANAGNGGLVASTIELVRYFSSINGSRQPALFSTPVQGYPGYVPPAGQGYTYIFYGSLPGTNSGVTLLPDQTVFAWLANTRPHDGSSGLQDEFNGNLTKAIKAVTSWPANDIFPQFDTSFSVVNGATSVVQPVAPESWVSLLGSALAESTATASGLALPTVLADTQVLVSDATGTSLPAELLSVSPAGITFVLPAAFQSGQVRLTLSSYGVNGRSAVVEVARVSPGIFTLPSAHSDVPEASAALYSADGTVTAVPLFHCEQPDQCSAAPMSFGQDTDRLIVSLYCTGLRHTADAKGVEARINGVAVPVLFAGSQGQTSGVDQVNIEVPRALMGAGAVPLQLTADGRTSNIVTIAVE